ncbi:uncharacterized protein LOC124162519 [Ischnura elegans]|uniref:uncharacterized protein LOC124162519 n=1 Tax=Ischnura elegans TaxID=197161 RepID=UPI001ED8ACB0|nr:uncharacterized protein LOC124162519 [Ischnura elegans]
MSEKNKYNSKKSKPRGPKEENVGTYFTKNNLQFVSRRIPTLQEMIEDRSNHPRFKHECKLHTSWVNFLSQDNNSSQTLNGGKKSVSRSQIAPSTISFATLYKATPTAKRTSSDLPKIHEKSPYQKYILEQKRLAEKCINIEEMQLESLEKENEEEIHRIAAQFCKKVKAWDEVDTTVSDALQSKNILEEKASDGQTDSTLEQSKMEKLVKTQDLSHLTDPEWVSDLFRISFTAPWSDGFTKVLREEGGTENISKGLDIPMSLMRSQRIDWNRVQKDRALLREAAKPKVAFGCAVPRARGLEEYEEQLKPHAAKPPHQLDPHKEHDLPMDLITMKAIWGDQLDSLSTKHYCRHLRELLRQKMDGTADPALSTVPMSQMKPKVLVEAGMLRTDESESHSSLSSLSSISSSSTTTQASTKRDK